MMTAAHALYQRAQAGYRVARVWVRRVVEGGRVAADATGWTQSEKQDYLAEEVPIALEYNGLTHAVMMASPIDLEDYALGFSLAEGHLARPGELFDLDVVDHGDSGVELKLRVHGACLDALRRQHRTLAGPSGCGLCGKASLDQVVQNLPRVTPRALPSPDAIDRAQASLKGHQSLQAMTGAIHAAAWCDANGRVLMLREDVGRHNALDKLIGALHHRPQPVETDGFVLMSSRASYELVAKAARVDLSTLVSVSGATSLAADQARATGLNLIGFARDGRQVIYHHHDESEPS